MYQVGINKGTVLLGVKIPLKQATIIARNMLQKPKNSYLKTDVQLSGNRVFFAWVCGRSLDGIARLNPAVGMMFFSRECCVCCQVGAPETGRSLVQRSPTERGVSQGV